MFTIVYLLFQAIGLVSSVHAILNTRTAQGAIAWAVSLNTLPVITVPIYWVFGRSKFEGYVNALKNSSLFMEEKQQQAHEAFAPFVVAGPEDFPEYRAIRKLSLSPFLPGGIGLPPARQWPQCLRGPGGAGAGGRAQHRPAVLHDPQ